MAARRRAGGRKRARGQRLAQIRAAFALTRKHDPRLVPLLAAVALGTLALFVVLGFVLDSPVLYGVIGLLAAFTAALFVFGRRAQRATFAQVEGQPGAAAAVLQSARGDWRVTPAVAFTRNQDLVHRAIGRPGVVLVAEGAPHRVAGLLAQERKRVSRVAAEVPVHEVVIGDDKGQVPLRKLQTHLLKLPRRLKPAQVNALDKRLKALPAGNLAMPKGPLPKNVKLPRGPRPPR